MGVAYWIDVVKTPRLKFVLLADTAARVRPLDPAGQPIRVSARLVAEYGKRYGARLIIGPFQLRVVGHTSDALICVLASTGWWQRLRAAWRHRRD